MIVIFLSIIYFLSLPTWFPITPPTAAPPTVPIKPPPVSTAPAAAPTPAPIAVLFSRAVMLLQALKLSISIVDVNIVNDFEFKFMVIPLSLVLKKSSFVHCSTTSSSFI